MTLMTLWVKPHTSANWTCMIVADIFFFKMTQITLESHICYNFLHLKNQQLFFCICYATSKYDNRNFQIRQRQVISQASLFCFADVDKAQQFSWENFIIGKFPKYEKSESRWPTKNYRIVESPVTYTLGVGGKKDKVGIHGKNPTSMKIARKTKVQWRKYSEQAERKKMHLLCNFKIR